VSVARAKAPGEMGVGRQVQHPQPPSPERKEPPHVPVHEMRPRHAERLELPQPTERVRKPFHHLRVRRAAHQSAGPEALPPAEIEVHQTLTNERTNERTSERVGRAKGDIQIFRSTPTGAPSKTACTTCHGSDELDALNVFRRGNASPATDTACASPAP